MFGVRALEFLVYSFVLCFDCMLTRHQIKFHLEIFNAFANSKWYNNRSKIYRFTRFNSFSYEFDNNSIALI